MSLPDAYLDYPRRRYGQDIDRYDWALAKDRAPVRLPSGKALVVTLVIPCEWFPLDPSGKPFKHPGAMQTPYPDLRHYTSRDYGNRVGVFRLLDALAAHGLRATFPLSAALLDRAPPLLDAIIAGGHEIAGAGLHTDAIHWGGLDPAEEARRIAEVRDAFARRDLAPRTWLSPARQESPATPDLIAAAGFDVCLDWEIDRVPTPLRVAQGRLDALPLANELEDWKLIIERRQPEASWTAQVLEAVRFSVAEAARAGAGALAVQATPYVLGQPFRIHAFEALCAALAAEPAVAVVPAGEAVEAFRTAAPETP